MKNFFNDFREFIHPYFEKEWEYSFKGVPFNEKPDLSDFILSFGFLKIVDMASYLDESPFSYESIHLTDLMNINEKYDILDNVILYIESLYDRTQEVFKHLRFNQIIHFLEDSKSLYEIIEFLCFPSNINSIEQLKEFYEDFINCYFDSSIYYEDYYNEFGDIINANDKKFNNFLIKLLFNDIDFKNKEKVNVYDPACGDASLLLSCKEFIKKSSPNCEVNLFGCESNPRLFAISLSKILFENQNHYYILMYDIDSKENFKKDMLPSEIDFVISNIGNVERLRPQKFSQYSDIYHIFSHLTINYKKLLFATSLRNIGYLFDIFTAEIYSDYLDSIITLPISSELKNNSIFILDNNKNQKRKNKFMLIDEYTENGKISNKKYKSIFFNYREFKEYENGIIVNNSDIGNSELFNFNDLFYDKKIGSAEENICKLNKLSLICISGMKNYDLLLSNNFKKKNKIAFYPHEVDIDEYDKYFSLKLKENYILKDYLYFYLNSNKGLNDIEFLTRFNDDLFRNIDCMRIPLPDIKEQKNVVDASKKLENFFNQMDLWKTDYLNNILNYRPALESYKEFSCDIPFSDDDEFSKSCKNWRIVYQGLAWPLAHSYLKATKGSTDAGIKKDNYLIFFEFLVAFNVIVLISAIKNNGTEEYDEIKDNLWQLHYSDKKTWHKMHFGGWTTLFSRLNGYYNEKDFSTPIKFNLLKELSKKEFKNLFNNLRNRRNDDRHGGLKDEIDVNTKLDKLEEYMDNNIFEILSLYCGLKFYYTDSTTEDISPNKEIRSVIPLNGPCNPYLKNKMEVKGKLKSYRLYFYDPLNNKYLEIDDDLMKFKKDEESGQYNLYIFNGISGKNVEYKCYQYDNLKWLIPIKNSEDSYFNVSEEFKKEVLRL